MSESLRNDGRIWVPKNPDDDPARPTRSPRSDRDYYLERLYPSFGNLAPRDIASRAAKREVDAGKGVGPLKNGVYLDFADAIDRLGDDVIEERYGNLFEMYERITGENPYEMPMRIYPAPPLHDGRALGRLRADDHDPGPVLRRRGQLLRPRRQPPRRVGADAGPGRRLLRAAVHDRQLPRPAARQQAGARPTTRRSRRPRPRPAHRFERLPVDRRHPVARLVPPRARQDHVGLLRHGAHRARASRRRSSEIPALHEEFQKDLRVTGDGASVNQTLEKAGRVDDFFELGKLMCRDALDREE